MTTFAYVIIGIASVALIIFLVYVAANGGVGKIKGRRGERITSEILDEYLKNNYGFKIDDVIVMGNNGKTSQIDHILFTTHGIFVIETKNIEGRIYGSIEQKYWTQVTNSYNKYQKYSPVFQNKTHVYRIKSLLKLRYGVYSCVVFTKNNTDYLKGCEQCVHNACDLLNYLNSKTEIIFKKEAVQQMYLKINDFKTNPRISEEEHIQNIRNFHDN